MEACFCHFIFSALLSALIVNNAGLKENRKALIANNARPTGGQKKNIVLCALVCGQNPVHDNFCVDVAAYVKRGTVIFRMHPVCHFWMVPDHTDSGRWQDSAVWHTLKNTKRRINNFSFLLNTATDSPWKQWRTIVLLTIFTTQDFFPVPLTSTELNWATKPLNGHTATGSNRTAVQTWWHGMDGVRVKWQNRWVAKTSMTAYKNRGGNQSQTDLYRAWPRVGDVFVVALKRRLFKDVLDSFYWIDANGCGVPVREMDFKTSVSQLQASPCKYMLAVQKKTKKTRLASVLAKRVWKLPSTDQ